jgi:putative nucleotidyltransferase with HDIG domain
MMAVMEMMPHIAAHSIQVCRVAVWLCQALEAAGRARLNLELVRAGGLLHDITKTRSFTTGEDHAQSGQVYLTRQGFGEVGSLVAQHVVLAAFDPEAPPNEAELINYADKRVMHDRIVSMPRRMADILARYGTSAQRRDRLRRLWQETERLEAKLFAGLGPDPEQVEEVLGPEGLAAALQEFGGCLQAAAGPVSGG